jgi:predicted ribosome quality control (RQC) complex YloA/Tae2 family protein
VNGNSNVAIGGNAGENLTGSETNNIDIGFDVAGVAGESNTVRIGNPDITTTIVRGISGQTIPSGAAVLVAANGQLGTATSSRRFKDEIKPMNEASEALFSLKPVTFRYKKEIDPTHAQQFGLVAEDVEKISPDLIVRDENGNVSTVRYDQVNAMLLNEFLKAHAKMERQEAAIACQQKQIQALEARLDQQATEIQDVRQKIARNTTIAANGSE